MSSNINAAQAHVENGFVLKSVIEQDNLLSEKLNVLTEQQNITEGKPSADLNSKSSTENVAESIDKIDASKESQATEPLDEEVEEALDIVSSFINSTLKQVTFSHDKNAGKMVITMVDKETQEVINQFPSEKIISMAGRIKELYQEVESISGLIIDSHV